MEFQDQQAGHDSVIGCLTYQSRARTIPSEAELNELVTRARARNHSVNVTGMLLYEDGHFLQTLEGPPEGLSAVWQSIKHDERHTDIEVLTEHFVGSRLFSDWDLLLYRKREQAPKSLWDKLRRKHALAQHVPSVVQCAFDANEQKLNNLLAMLAETGWSGEEIVRHLIEPAARAMGDAWMADECCEFDLTLGLGILQLASHAVRYSHDAQTLRQKNYTILLATAPGEPHMLAPSLLAGEFTDAGWDVEMVNPASDEALANQLSEQQPDAVDIALSDALPRHGMIAQLRETVRHSRIAMPDQPLVVSVGGRLFAEATATAEHVGADLSRLSIAGTRLRMTELVAHARKVRKPV